MKFIIKYSFIGVIMLLLLVGIVTRLPLAASSVNGLLTVGGLVLFTILGALLKTKVKISPAEQVTKTRN